MYRKTRLFFKNKTCHYCKKPGTIFRMSKGNNEVICESKECDKKSRVKAGHFGIGINI